MVETAKEKLNILLVIQYDRISYELLRNNSMLTTNYALENHFHKGGGEGY